MGTDKIFRIPSRKILESYFFILSKFSKNVGKILKNVYKETFENVREDFEGIFSGGGRRNNEFWGFRIHFRNVLCKISISIREGSVLRNRNDIEFMTSFDDLYMSNQGRLIILINNTYYLQYTKSRIRFIFKKALFLWVEILSHIMQIKVTTHLWHLLTILSHWITTG